MSFYTSLTGLNGAQADISTISNNIANVGTTGFKRSRAEFGDIFATSPLQNASSAVGSGTILKSIKQQFTQGNIQSSLNALDLAISGQGFFAMKPSLTSSQTVYTRNGSFSVNNDRYVVDDKGQYLQVFPVNDDGSVTSTGAASATNLQLPVKSGLPNATTLIQLGLNLPADASIIPQDPKYTASNPYVFNHNDPTTFNKSTSITIYDSLGNPTISTIYYLKTSNSTDTDPTNKWMTHVFVGDKELNPSLITAKDAQSATLYVNKFGQTTTDPTQFDPSFVANQPSPLYYQDDQIKKVSSTPAKVVGEIQSAKGFDFGDTDANKVTIITEPSAYSTTHEANAAINTSTYWGKDMFTVSVDGSTPQSISINAGSYTGDELAAEMTRAVNAKFSDAKYFRISDTYRDASNTVIAGNDVFNINLSSTSPEGTTIALNPPLEIDLLGTAGAAGTPASDTSETTSGVKTQQLNYQDLTRSDLISLAQTKVNEQLNNRHNDFGKSPNWIDTSNPPIVVGFDVSSRSLTFKVDPAQLGTDAQLPENRYQSIQVYNPTNLVNDLGIPTQTTSTSTPIGTNSQWSEQAVLPSGPPITAANDQRTGIIINYNKDTRQFEFSSGTTGENSKIIVGRTTLAQTVDDTMTQINSYDLSHMNMTDKQSITLESDGRTFTYSYDPNGLSNSQLTSPESFISNLKQSLPVSFSPITESRIGSSGQSEIQSITPWGNLLSGDQFTLNMQLSPSSASTNTGPSVNISPITLPIFTRADSPSIRLQKLADALQAAIDTQNNVSPNDPKPVTVSVYGSSLTFTYQPGFVSHQIAISQITRGIDNSNQSPIRLTDRTVISTSTQVDKAGNSKTQEVQTLSLQPTITTNTLQIQAGDVYRITVPKTDGTVATEDLTVGAIPPGSNGLAELALAIQTAAGTSGTGDLKKLADMVTADTMMNSVTFTYANNAAIVGKFAIQQIKTTPANSTAIATVRSDSMGPISISSDSNGHLLVEGSPSGEPFRLNLQINSQVQPAEPQGASLTQPGRQIGQSMATSATSPLMFQGNNDLLGIGVSKTETILSGTGLSSSAAVAFGGTAITPMNQTFVLNEGLGENKMTFTIDGITGSITLPIRAYTGDTLASAIQQRINQIQDPVSGRVVSGATVSFDPTNNRLKFTSGTTGSSSQFNVVGPANFGLNMVTQNPGNVPLITPLTQAVDQNKNPLYVDANGNITTVKPSTKTQTWAPLYLTPGELKFDTSGKLASSTQGVVYSPFNPGNGANPLNLTIDYGKYSTQYTQPFSVLSLQQDGYTSGQLDGLNIDANGTVRANYTNGQTKALGKIILANFANPNGLKQVGNSNYVANSVSGEAVLGQAGADGFGSIQSGALERSNVDITEELVTLITAQRNFQANSKAIETETTLTQTIIQIRG